MAKQTKQSLEVQNNVAEYRLRVERKKGDWLKEHELELKARSTDSTQVLRLRDIGITRDESSKAQRIANLTKQQFEDYVSVSLANVCNLWDCFLLIVFGNFLRFMVPFPVL